jgi:hypothetical protein
MEKSQKVGAQIYGYTICLVAVITFLISITTLVNAVIDLEDPIHAGWTQPGSPSLASFENYKMDLLKTSKQGDETNQPSYVPDDETLRAMYQAAKDDKIQSVRHQSHRSIIIDFILIIISFALFITHWRWMKKITV